MDGTVSFGQLQLKVIKNRPASAARDFSISALIWQVTRTSWQVHFVSPSAIKINVLFQNVLTPHHPSASSQRRMLVRKVKSQYREIYILSSWSTTTTSSHHLPRPFLWPVPNLELPVHVDLRPIQDPGCNSWVGTSWLSLNDCANPSRIEYVDGKPIEAHVCNKCQNSLWIASIHSRGQEQLRWHRRELPDK